MKTKNYLILCGGVVVVVAALVMTVPAVANLVEGVTLGFLATYAQ